MNQQVVMTPQVVADINEMVGTSYEAATLNQHVGSCFSQIDFDFYDAPSKGYPCRDCRIQLACAIYRAERAGYRGVRDKYLIGIVKPADGSPIPAPPELMDAIEQSRKAKPLQPPPPPPTQAPEAPEAPEVVTARPPPVTTAPPSSPPVATTAPPPSPPTPPSSAPTPEAIAAAASPIPLNGAPPDGWPQLDRERLAAICLAVGYTEQDLFKKRATTLVTMILKRKPEWDTNEPEPAVEPVAAPPAVPVDSTDPDPDPAPAPVVAVQTPAASAAPVVPAATKRVAAHVAAVRYQGNASAIAVAIIETFGDRIVEVHVADKDAT